MSRFIEEENAKEVDIVSLYNTLNTQYFDSSLPKGVAYSAAAEKANRYGMHISKTVGIGYTRRKSAIGTATSVVGTFDNSVDVSTLVISTMFDFVPTDVATASNGEGTLIGIMLHEMCHFVVTLGTANVYEWNRRKKREGAHGSTFMNAVKTIQNKLDAKGINIKIPASESTMVEYDKTRVPETIVIQLVTPQGQGVIFMTPSHWLKKRGDIMKFYGHLGDIFVWKTTNESVLQFQKSLKIPLSGKYNNRVLPDIISDTSRTTQIERLWKE